MMLLKKLHTNSQKNIYGEGNKNTILTPSGSANLRIKDKTMFILYYKQLHIVKEPMTKNCTCQTYRGKQIAMCKDKKPLQDYIDKQKDKDRFYIEEQPR